MQQLDFNSDTDNQDLLMSFDDTDSQDMLSSFEDSDNQNILTSFEDDTKDVLMTSFDGNDTQSDFSDTTDILTSFSYSDLQQVAHFVNSEEQDIFDTEDYDQSEELYQSFEDDDSATIDTGNTSSNLQEAVLQKKIKNLLYKRQKATITDSINHIHSQTSRARDELRVYINNVHPNYNLTYNTGKNFSWGNHNFFSILGSIFEKQYYTTIDREQKSLTFEDFISSDIKPNLLELGNRLDSSVRDLLQNIDSCSPIDLLQTEAAINAFKLKIRAFITHLELRDTGNNIAFTEISNMRINLTNKYLKSNTFDVNTDNCCFTEGYAFDAAEPYFICGSCGEIHKMTEYPLKLLHLPFSGKVLTDKNYVVLDIINSHICPSCGKHNILTLNEYELLHKELIQTMASSLEEYSKISQSTCNTFAITEYTISNTNLIGSLVHLLQDYSTIETTDTTKENEEENSNKQDVDVVEDEQEFLTTCLDSEFKAALHAYRDLLKAFKVDLKYDLSPIDSMPKSEWRQGVLGNTVPYNTDITRCTDILYQEETCYNLNILAKFICSSINLNYDSLKDYAINSLLLYIKASPLSNYLGFKRLAIQKAIINSSAIIEELDNLDTQELNKLLPYLAEMCKTKSKDKESIKEDLKVYFSDCSKVLDDLRDKKSSLINQLYYCTRLFAFVPIVKANRTEEVTDLLYDEDFVKFVNVTSDLMVITQYLERFIKLWRVRSNKKAVANLKNIENVNSINNLQYSLDLYENLGLLTLTKGYPKETKTLNGQHMFSITKSLFDFKLLEGLNLLHKTFAEQDEFEMFRCIIALEELTSSFVGVSNVKIYNYDTAIFTPVRECIEALLPIAKSFVETYGNTDEDKLYYYLHDYFTREEIHQNFSSRYTNINLTKIIPRKNNESLQSYLINLLNAQKQGSKEMIFFQPKYLDEVFKYFGVLCSCSLPVMFFNNIKGLHAYLAFIEIIYFSLNFPLSKILSALSINANILGKFVTGYSEGCFVENASFAYNKIQMLNSITTHPEFNNFGDFSELYLSDAFDKVDLDMSDEERLEVIENNREDYLKSIKHLKEDAFVEYINFKE